MSTRIYRPKWLEAIRSVFGLKKRARRTKRKLWRKKTVRFRPPRSSTKPLNLPVKRGSLIEWLPHPELGRGTVLQVFHSHTLDVEFEAGGRPMGGVPLEEISILRY